MKELPGSCGLTSSCAWQNLAENTISSVAALPSSLTQLDLAGAAHACQHSDGSLLVRTPEFAALAALLLWQRLQYVATRFSKTQPVSYHKRRRHSGVASQATSLHLPRAWRACGAAAGSQPWTWRGTVCRRWRPCLPSWGHRCAACAWLATQ